MHAVIRIMLVLAALAYGAMPVTGMAQVMPGMSMAEPQAISADSAGHNMQAGGDHNAAASQASSIDPDCPHQTTASDKTDMARGHCSACLTLAAEIVMRDAGRPARAAQAAAVANPLLSLLAAPLDPPPRA